MNMENYEIEFYITEKGKCPVKEFLMSVDVRMRAKIKRGLDLLSEFGPYVREPYSKSLDGGIFELRTKLGTDITRVLYFFFVGRKIILTNGFVKKTNKTPKNELEWAQSAKKDYERRNEENE